MLKIWREHVKNHVFSLGLIKNKWFYMQSLYDLLVAVSRKMLIELRKPANSDLYTIGHRAIGEKHQTGCAKSLNGALSISGNARMYQIKREMS